MTIPSTSERVEHNTADHINRAIRDQMEARVRYFADHPEKIAHRLAELDREWDIERAIEANASTLALAGTLLGITRNRFWLLVPVAVSGFLLQHAVHGWCPPVPVLRRLGFRTAHEIERERRALMMLRGDFAHRADGGDRARVAIEAAARA
jgi:hypothetical protein